MAEQHSDFDAFDRQCEDLRNKWLRRRAKPEVWTAVERFGKNDMDTLNCVLELRSRVEALENDRRAVLDTGSRLKIGLDASEQAVTRDRDETGDYLIIQSKSALTVEDCSKMPKHGENFLLETRNGEIHLDGYFTREDLIEIANTIPSRETS